MKGPISFKVTEKFEPQSLENPNILFQDDRFELIVEISDSFDYILYILVLVHYIKNAKRIYLYLQYVFPILAPCIRRRLPQTHLIYKA